MVAQVTALVHVSAQGIGKFIARFVDPAGTMLVTDEFSGYRRVSETLLHATLNHAVEYANGSVHTNTIEGFWSLVKCAWYGQHHWYSRKYMPLYIAEACYKYNRRKDKDGFGRTLAAMAIT